MSANSDSFDVLVLGGGSAGYACALRAAQLGQRVALIEKNQLGGTCLHSGCIPTKALLHAAEVADATRDADAIGVMATFDGVDMTKVRAYQDRVIDRLFKGLTGLIRSRSVQVIEGMGCFVGPRTIEVDGRRYTGKHVVVATGSHTRALPGIALDGERVLGSEHALNLDNVPGSVIVLGGGVIGCEFASVWRSFGSDVTIVEALPRLVPAEDEASSKALERAFRKRGIRLVTGTMVQSVDTNSDGVLVHTSTDGALSADVVLVAVGRGPSTDGMGLVQHGIQLDRGFVVVDENLRTTAENVFAVGDIVPGLQLAHRGFAQGIFVAEQIAGLQPTLPDEALIPRVTYSDPEVASVGMTERLARELHGEGAVDALTYDLAGNGKSQILGTQGFIKLVRRVDGPVIGVHIVGARAGELIGEAQVMTAWEALPEDVTPLIHAHPTQGEALGEAFLALGGKPLHAHG